MLEKIKNKVKTRRNKIKVKKENAILNRKTPGINPLPHAHIQPKENLEDMGADEAKHIYNGISKINDAFIKSKEIVKSAKNAPKKLKNLKNEINNEAIKKASKRTQKNMNKKAKKVNTKSIVRFDTKTVTAGVPKATKGDKAKVIFGKLGKKTVKGLFKAPVSFAKNSIKANTRKIT